jgi:hypothetical protein
MLVAVYKQALERLTSAFVFLINDRWMNLNGVPHLGLPLLPRRSPGQRLQPAVRGEAASRQPGKTHRPRDRRPAELPRIPAIVPEAPPCRGPDGILRVQARLAAAVHK